MRARVPAHSSLVEITRERDEIPRSLELVTRHIAVFRDMCSRERTNARFRRQTDDTREASTLGFIIKAIER